MRKCRFCIDVDSTRTPPTTSPRRCDWASNGWRWAYNLLTSRGDRRLRLINTCQHRPSAPTIKSTTTTRCHTIKDFVTTFGIIDADSINDDSLWRLIASSMENFCLAPCT